MVVGTLSLVQEGQTRGHSGRSMLVNAVRSGIVVYGGGDIVFGAKRSNQRMQWMQYAVDTVRSGIVIYGGGDIVFGAKRSNQWTQYAVHSTQWNGGIWWWGNCLWCKKGQTSGHSGNSMQWTQYMVVGILSLGQKGQTSGHSGCNTQWMQWKQWNSDIW